MKKKLWAIGIIAIHVLAAFLLIGYWLMCHHIVLTNQEYKKSVSPSDSMQLVVDSLKLIDTTGMRYGTLAEEGKDIIFQGRGTALMADGDSVWVAERDGTYYLAPKRRGKLVIVK